MEIALQSKMLERIYYCLKYHVGISVYIFVMLANSMKGFLQINPQITKML